MPSCPSAGLGLFIASYLYLLLAAPRPAAQVLAPAKTVIENVGGSLDLKERESHLRAWGFKKASRAGWSEGRMGRAGLLW